MNTYRKGDITDYGPEPLVVNLNKVTQQNNTFRTALWTGEHLQLTLMTIPVGEDIGLEIHPTLDQFLYIVDGCGVVKMGNNMNALNYQQNACPGYATFVPAGTWHNMINMGNRPIKLYSIYAPTQHPRGTVQEKKPQPNVQT